MPQVEDRMLESFDYEHSTIQALMNYAYTDALNPEDQKSLTGTKFWAKLPLRARIAVYVGDLNYQVGNGGFDQWVSNRFSACADDLVAFLVKLPKAGPAVAKMIQIVIDRDAKNRKHLHLFRGIDLNKEFAKLKISMFHEVEVVLTSCPTDEELSNWMKKVPDRHVNVKIISKLEFIT